MLTIKKCLGCGLHYQMQGAAYRCEPCRRRHKVAARSTPAALKKGAARYQVKRAIAKGALVRGGCQKCGSPDAQAHHVDYDKPLKIKWLCTRCHARLHTKQRLRARIAAYDEATP